MLSSERAWQAIVGHTPRGRWIPITDLYRVVSEHVDLEGADHDPISASNSSPRWKRTVRNALHRQKTSGALEWDGKGQYRLP
jgi:hypothetical protein